VVGQDDAVEAVADAIQRSRWVACNFCWFQTVLGIVTQPGTGVSSMQGSLSDLIRPLPASCTLFVGRTDWQICKSHCLYCCYPQGWSLRPQPPHCQLHVPCFLAALTHARTACMYCCCPAGLVCQTPTVPSQASCSWAPQEWVRQSWPRLLHQTCSTQRTQW
jgi:hypothetical protein